MKKGIKRSLAVIFSSILLASMGMVGASAETTHTENTMQNEYIKASFSTSNGKYIFYTVLGNPDVESDNNSVLLYNRSYTSYSTVFIDDAYYIVGDSGEKQLSFDEERNAFVYVNSINNVTVEQVVEIIYNPSTGREDLFKMSYTVTNNNEESKDIGFRIMIDTMLGNNDRSPFRIPGEGDVYTAMEFEGDNIPSYYNGSDSMSSPTVFSYGKFQSGENRPDKVQFMNWATAEDTPWNVETGTGSIGDSAVVSNWYEKPLASGESRTYEMYYGVGQLNINVEGELALSATATNEAVVKEDNSGYEDIDVLAYLENIGTDNLTNAAMSIELPEDVTLIAGDTEITDEELAVGETINNTWKISITPSEVEKVVTLKITANADNVESKDVEININVPAIEAEPKGKIGLSATATNQAVINEDNNGYEDIDVSALLENIGTDKLINAAVSIELPEGVTLVENDTEVTAEELAISETLNNTWKIRIDASEVEKVVTLKVIATADDVDTKETELSINVPAIKGELDLSASAIDEAVINEDNSGYEDIDVSALLENIGTGNLSNVTVSIELPEGVTLVEGDAEVTDEEFTVSEALNNTWKIRIDKSDVEKVVTLKIVANADNAEAKETELNINVPAIVEEITPEPTPNVPGTGDNTSNAVAFALTTAVLSVGTIAAVSKKKERD